LAKALDTPLYTFLQSVFACSPQVAVSIGRCAIERHFPEQTTILKQGDRAEVTYLVIAGRIHALIYGAQGQLALLREYLPGDFFGAIANSTPDPEEADVVAVEDVRTAVFLILDFLGLAETHACVGLALSKMLLKQLRATSMRISERSTLSAIGRVHAELLRMARLDDGDSIRPAPVLASLAVRAHTTRETVSRAINALERRGIITRQADVLMIVARHRLEELVV
jgi:CRP/FNR family transcriptional regulator, cyclic AMP receptor protein